MKRNYKGTLIVIDVLYLSTSLLSSIPEKDYHATTRLKQFEAAHTALACLRFYEGEGRKVTEK